MEYRGGMIPDQWPRSVQADIEAVRKAVQNVDMDTQSVKLAVQALDTNLSALMRLLFAASDSAQVTTRNSVLSRITTDLAAVRTAVEAVKTAVENRGTGVVLVQAYNASGKSEGMVNMAAVTRVTFHSDGYNTRLVVSQGTTASLVYVNMTEAAFRALMLSRGIHFVDTSPRDLPPPPRPWWDPRAWRWPRRRPVALGLLGGTT